MHHAEKKYPQTYARSQRVPCAWAKNRVLESLSPGEASHHKLGSLCVCVLRIAVTGAQCAFTENQGSCAHRMRNRVPTCACRESTHWCSVLPLAWRIGPQSAWGGQGCTAALCQWETHSFHHGKQTSRTAPRIKVKSQSHLGWQEACLSGAGSGASYAITVGWPGGGWAS